MIINKFWEILLVISFCGLLSPLAMAGESKFNFIYDENGNRLDTFKGTYTRNMYVDPPVTIKLALSAEELNTIYQKMVEMDFFNFPKDFFSDFDGWFPPHVYYIKIKNSMGYKEFFWGHDKYDPKTAIILNKTQEKKLHELVSLIDSIIHSKEEVKKIPFPRSVPI